MARRACWRSCSSQEPTTNVSVKRSGSSTSRCRCQRIAPVRRRIRRSSAARSRNAARGTRRERIVDRHEHRSVPHIAAHCRQRQRFGHGLIGRRGARKRQAPGGDRRDRQPAADHQERRRDGARLGDSAEAQRTDARRALKRHQVVGERARLHPRRQLTLVGRAHQPEPRDPGGARHDQRDHGERDAVGERPAPPRRRRRAGTQGHRSRAGRVAAGRRGRRSRRPGLRCPRSPAAARIRPSPAPAAGGPRSEAAPRALRRGTRRRSRGRSAPAAPASCAT